MTDAEAPALTHAGTRIAGQNGGTLTPYDANRAREAARIRWDKANAAALRGMTKAGQQIPDVSRRGPAAVVEYLVEQHTLHAADPSAPGSVQSFKQVMAIAYPKPDSEKSGDVVADGGVQLNLSAGAVRELLAALRDRRNSGGSGDTGT